MSNYQQKNNMLKFSVMTFNRDNRVAIWSDINSMRRGNAVAPNKRNSVPCTVRTSRQWSCNQRVSCLVYRVVRIYVGKRVLEQAQNARVCSLVVARRAIEFKYRNTAYQHNITNSLEPSQEQCKASTIGELNRIWSWQNLNKNLEFFRILLGWNRLE